PTTASSSPLPDPLSAQIVSGAGTTTLTLSTPASNTVTSNTILFDDGPAIVATANAVSSTGGFVYIPGNLSISSAYVINSFTHLPNYVKVAQSGQVYLYETLAFGNATEWYGKLYPSPSSPPAF